MALNINLFVHGVPMGQKIWGPRGTDQPYLSSFYGPNWDAPELMKVDVMTFGGVTNCYYSLVIGQNVCDSQGREGSYFALTLKFNAYYADVQNMYNILKATYDKMCVDLCLQVSNGTTKFTIPDFQSIDDKLKAIEASLLNYISNFSINDDIVALNGLPKNCQPTSKRINLHECTKKVAFDCIKQTGSLMFSPWYLSVGAANTVAKYKAEMQNTIQKAQQEIQLQQQASQEKINTITAQSQERIESIKAQSREELASCKEASRKQLEKLDTEHKQKIAQIKEEYTDFEQKMAVLKNEKKELDQKIKDYKIENDKKEKKNKSLQKEVTKLSQEINSLRAGATYPLYPEPKKTNRIVVCCISFFIVVLVGCLGCYIYSQSEENNSLKDKIKEMQTEKKQLEDKLNNCKEKEIATYDEGGKQINSGGQQAVDYSNVKIDIWEFVKGKKTMSPGETCHVSLLGGVDENLGKWQSKDFDINGNAITPKRGKTGECVLEFVIDGKTIQSRPITVK